MIPRNPVNVEKRRPATSTASCPTKAQERSGREPTAFIFSATRSALASTDWELNLSLPRTSDFFFSSATRMREARAAYPYPQRVIAQLVTDLDQLLDDLAQLVVGHSRTDQVATIQGQGKIGVGEKRIRDRRQTGIAFDSGGQFPDRHGASSNCPARMRTIAIRKKELFLGPSLRSSF